MSLLPVPLSAVRSVPHPVSVLPPMPIFESPRVLREIPGVSSGPRVARGRPWWHGRDRAHSASADETRLLEARHDIQDHEVDDPPGGVLVAVDVVSVAVSLFHHGGRLSCIEQAPYLRCAGTRSCLITSATIAAVLRWSLAASFSTVVPPRNSDLTRARSSSVHGRQVFSGLPRSRFSARLSSRLFFGRRACLATSRIENRALMTSGYFYGLSGENTYPFVGCMTWARLIIILRVWLSSMSRSFYSSAIGLADSRSGVDGAPSRKA